MAMSAISKLRKSPGFVTFVVSISIFTDTLLYSIVIPALPSFLRNQVHVDPNDVQNLTSALLASYGGAVLFSSVIVGALTDRAQSKKTPFILGLILLLGATLMFFLSHDIGIVITARVLQGVSAAIVWTSGLTFLYHRVSKEQVGSSMGYVTAGSSVGELVGPTLGGVAYDRTGHMGLFAIAAAVITLDIVLRLLLPDENPGSSGHGEDGREQHDSATEPLLPSAGRNSEQTPNNKEAKPKSAIALLLTDLDFLASITAFLIVAVMRCGLETTIPIFTEKQFGWQATQGGLVLLILVVPSLASPFFGHIAGKFGAHLPSTISLLLITGFYIALAFQPIEGVAGIVIFCICVFGIGLGLFAGQTANMVAVAEIAGEVGSITGDPNAQENNPTGHAFAFMTLSSAGGFLLGPIIAGPIVSKYGWLPFCLTFAGLALVSAFISFLRIIKREQHQR